MNKTRFSPEGLERLRLARLGYKVSEETREKLRRSSSGHVVSDETRRRISAAKLGFKHSDESKAKMKMARRGKCGYLSVINKSKEHRSAVSLANKGRIITKQWRERIGKALAGHAVTQETRNKIGKAYRGLKRSEAAKENMRREHSAHWNGGIRHHCGYIQITSPAHPFCNKKKYVAAHRLVVEKLIGKYLQPGESAHHINKTRDDNRPENLMAFISESAHQRFEKGGKSYPKDILFDGRLLKH